MKSEHCDDFLSSLLCRSKGPCFRPLCEAGLCTCHNGTGLDVDCDNVTCPDDCNDLNSAISRSITCVRDHDGDQYPDCVASGSFSDDDDDESSSSSDSDDDDDEYCLVMCVEPNATCPHGYTDPNDPDRFSRQRTHRRRGKPCSPMQLPTIAESDCDDDARAHPNSQYVGSAPNKCGALEYNCDNTTTTYACCTAGSFEEANARYLWHVSTCHVVAQGECGGCTASSEHGGNTSVLVAGWACESECPAENAVSTVQEGACPPVCENECRCVDSATSIDVGECAKVVTSCVRVRHSMPLYADVEECCVTTAQ
jgi:hypothetical protein